MKQQLAIVATIGALLFIPAGATAQIARTQIGVSVAVDTASHFEIHPRPQGVVAQIVVTAKDTGVIALAFVGAAGRTSARQIAPFSVKDDHAMSYIGGARLVVSANRWFRPFGEVLAGGLRYAHHDSGSDPFGHSFEEVTTHWGGTVGGGAGVDVAVTRRLLLSIEAYSGHALRRITASVSVAFGRSR